MCTVSSIGDEWTKTFPTTWPNINPVYPVLPADQSQVEELRKEIEALKDLLKAAKIYDEKTGQPDCEMDEKVALIKRLAELLEVDMEDVFG